MGFLALGLVLRLWHIAAPLLDHPGWRQGDTASIARNFVELRYNILFPQVEYNGPPPNYVELELQIIPFLAATAYKLVGVHPIIGRLIAIAFGLGTIAVTGALARWLFASTAAGIAALALAAIFPGSIYYSRTFQPDGAMVFFFVAALYAWGRFVVDGDGRDRRGALAAWALLALAFLAKPVALIALIPVVALALARYGWRGALARPLVPAVLLGSLLPYALYQPFVAAHAEWHWASGIVKLHVLPSLAASLTNLHAFAQKQIDFAHAVKMLGWTMLGPVGLALLVAGFCVRLRSKADALLWGWLGAGLLYAYVVVTVEKVDYYLYPLVPLGAVAGGHALARLFAWNEERDYVRPRAIVLAVLGLGWLATLSLSAQILRPYYRYAPNNYARAVLLDRTLAPGALIVMGHYGPDLMYYIHRKGWMEDPYLWTPFDEQSAIRKGARYFIAVEPERLKRNVELSHWLERFPIVNPGAKWPVYETDYAKMLPGAEERWQEFRRREKAGLLDPSAR